MADNERPHARHARGWVHEAIETGAIDVSAPYVGFSEEAIAKLADSAFAEGSLLVRLRNEHGDWRIVTNAMWIRAWFAAAEPERIHGGHGVSFGPADVRDVYPVADGTEPGAPI